MQLVIAVLQVKTNGLVREAKKANLASWGMMAGFFLIPVLAPQYSASSVAATVINLVAMGLGIGMVCVGGWRLLRAGNIWGSLLDVIGLVVGGSLVVTAGFNVFNGNSLGDVVYNLIVEIFSS
jgi:DNA-binding transcriptional LysR family regulator